MPSFDIVSEVDMHEVTNAVDQTNREIGNRFDFKGTGAKVEQTDATIALKGENDFQIDQMLDILHKKMAKRDIDIAALEAGKIETSGNKATLPITVRQGIDQDTARKIIKLIKETRIKVQTSIQGEKVRVSGKKRDDLQAVISMLRDVSIELPLQYINFRD
ncbi:MAG: YajQ family cyclic di-GMP-binding protein [Gammaproteobacteria bacterium]|nr:YajQ family cyclic di-GMP-binding protein [Gammaproteobacteria bacterium]MDH3561108.1 YajQ family cyclic di-GMP-binding protein [Gammaproteobacteria bacterium]